MHAFVGDIRIMVTVEPGVATTRIWCIARAAGAKNRAIDTSPAWSPTGREIAFTSDRTGTPQVYVMDREGGNLKRLTYEVGYTDSPSWSPKGDQIAFVSRTGSGFDIYVCRADGSG